MAGSVGGVGPGAGVGGRKHARTSKQASKRSGRSLSSLRSAFRRTLRRERRGGASLYLSRRTPPWFPKEEEVFDERGKLIGFALKVHCFCQLAAAPRLVNCNLLTKRIQSHARNQRRAKKPRPSYTDNATYECAQCGQEQCGVRMDSSGRYEKTHLIPSARA